MPYAMAAYAFPGRAGDGLFSVLPSSQPEFSITNGKRAWQDPGWLVAAGDVARWLQV